MNADPLDRGPAVLQIPVVSMKSAVCSLKNRDLSVNAFEVDDFVSASVFLRWSVVIGYAVGTREE